MTDQPASPGSALVTVESGEWAGWRQYHPGDPFEDHAGPFYCRKDEDGAVVCGFRPGPVSANGFGAVHGGALMTFADYALFVIAGGIDGSIHGVTVTCNCEFLGAAEPGRLLVARGEVLRAGGSLVFVRGVIRDEDRAVLAFSATLKRRKRS